MCASLMEEIWCFAFNFELSSFFCFLHFFLHFFTLLNLNPLFNEFNLINNELCVTLKFNKHNPSVSLVTGLHLCTYKAVDRDKMFARVKFKTKNQWVTASHYIIKGHEIKQFPPQPVTVSEDSAIYFYESCAICTQCLNKTNINVYLYNLCNFPSMTDWSLGGSWRLASQTLESVQHMCTVDPQHHEAMGQKVEFAFSEEAKWGQMFVTHPPHWRGNTQYVHMV